MRFPRTIGFRIALGFGLLIIAIVFNTILSCRIVEKIQNTQMEYSDVLEPSIRKLIELQAILHQSKDQLQSWDYKGRDAESPTLQKLRSNLQIKFPAKHQEILQISPYWNLRDQEKYAELFNYINDSLYRETSKFTSNLHQIASPGTFSTKNQVSDLMKHYEFADNELADLINRFDGHTVQANERTGRIYQKTRNILLLTGVLIALAGILIATLLYFALVSPIRQYSDTITSMGKGIIPDKKFREGSDDMGQIGAALNNMIKGLGDLSVFAEEIGKGNFKSDFSPLSDRDILGNSLIRLREDLQNAVIEEEKRKREDERRNWSNQGIARFSEILREFTGDTQTLSNKLIAELVNYLGARVGGIFLIQSGNSGPGEINMIACYAYGRTKHLKKTIKPGEGLVGRCVQEGSTIFLTDIPEDYIKIKSGLGEDNPKSLLIVPIRLNELIIGVIEIASLEIIHDFQIDFVERIGSSIASSLSGEHKGHSKKQDSK